MSAVAALPVDTRNRATGRSGTLTPLKVLTGYLILLIAIPSTLTLPSLSGIGTPANVYALLMLLWYVVSWLTGKIVPPQGTRPPRVVYCFFGLAVFLAYISAATRNSSQLEIQAADRGLIALAAWAGLVILPSAGLRTWEELDRLLHRLVYGASAISVMGIAEFFTNRSLAAYLKLPGLQQSVDALSIMRRDGYTRPMATATQPLELGGLIAMLLPFAIQQAIADAGKRKPLRRWFPVAAMAGVLPLGVSRTSAIGALIVMIVLFSSWPARRRWPAIGIVVLGLGAVKVMVPGLLSEIVNLFKSFLSNSDSSTQARTMDYAGVAPYVKARPWFGRGLGTFLPQLYRYTDNMYLLGIVEVGIIGVLAIIALYITMMHCAAAGRRRFTDPNQRELGKAFTAAAAVALISSATFDTLTFPMFTGTFFLLLGCSGAYLGIARRGPELPAGAP